MLWNKRLEDLEELLPLTVYVPLITSDIPEKNPSEKGLKLISILKLTCLSAHHYSSHQKLTEDVEGGLDSAVDGWIKQTPKLKYIFCKLIILIFIWNAIFF